MKLWPLVPPRHLCFGFVAITEREREPPRKAARTRSRRPSGYRGGDRGWQVRHHVPIAGAADARSACRGRRRSRRGARA